MANLRTIILSAFTLLALTLGELNAQQQRIRSGERGNRKAYTNARQLQLDRNTLRGAPASQEQFLRTSSTEKDRYTRRNGLGRNYLKRKKKKGNDSRQNLVKQAKASKLETYPTAPTNDVADSVREQPGQTTVAPVQTTIAPVQTTIAPVPIVSSAPSAAPSVFASLSPSVPDVEDAVLSDSDGVNNSGNSTSGRVGDDETATDNRDRLGSPTRADPDERDNVSATDSDSAAANVTTGRIDNESKDDNRIGTPTRNTDRDDLTSDTTLSSEFAIGASNETTGRLDEGSKDDNRIGSPSRSTTRDNFAPSTTNSTALADTETNSTNEVSSRASEENKDDRRIGSPSRSTNRTDVIANVNSAFLDV